MIYKPFTRVIQIDGKVYTLTYDYDHVLDTIEHNGKLMVSTHRVAQKIIKNADEIFHMRNVKGVKYC